MTKNLCATDRWHTDFMLVCDSDGGSHVIYNVCACYQPKCLEDNVFFDVQNAADSHLMT